MGGMGWTSSTPGRREEAYSLELHRAWWEAYEHRCPHTWAHNPHPQRLVQGNSVSYIQKGGRAVVLRVEWCSLAERECPRILGCSTLFCRRIPEGGREWKDETIHLHGQLEPLHSLLVVHYCFQTAPVLEFRVQLRNKEASADEEPTISRVEWTGDLEAAQSTASHNSPYPG